MRIVQYMLGFRSADGGVVRALIDLCAGLAASGHEVIVLTTDSKDAPADWDGRENRPRLERLPTATWTRARLGRAGVRAAGQAFQGADVVHLHVPWDPICVQLGGLAHRMMIPHVITLHGMLDDWTMGHKTAKKRLYLALAGRRLLESAAFVHCAASVEAEQSGKWFPRGRIRTAPLPFDLSPFTDLPDPRVARDRLGLSASRPVLLHLGRLHPIKRIEMLLEAASKLRTGAAPCQVVIAGSGERRYEESLRRCADSLNLLDLASFPGFIGGADKLSLLAAADLVVHPSAHESFGYSMIEALASGTPVVTTRAVNIWPELESGGGALIVDQAAAALADGLAMLLGDQDRRRAMAARGRQWVLEYLEPERVLAMYQSMYRDARPHGLNTSDPE
jgi:glycosyltransferase involved in cell wall biosynthesis